ncbi:BTB/POZ domain-containing protein 3-like [Mercenaria mercenaria]|uniref:BTB/POZ domain-containing protein 3-like n=1 Tax=Mercenaria mercenaria TaxID=6596 RepID=UPI00234E4A67|nr:BTB/POZ domain-containing protein 3-like [Mercenaria mercenaria]
MDASTNINQCQQTLLPDWQIGKDLSCCMTEIYDKKLWTDVKFRCKDHDDDERIYAHKTILAARSPVFQAMFFGTFTESKEEVPLKDAEKGIFDLFLRYIYSDAVTLEGDTASELLQMAHLYQVPRLVQVCADFLEKNITPENACEILTLALGYEISSLKEACCTVIDQNARQVLRSDGFMDLKEDVLHHILKGDTFYVDEEEIFLKAEEWSIKKLRIDCLEQNGDNIRKALAKSFYQLRLPTMSYETMVKCTQNKGYLSADECKDIADFISGISDASVSSNSCVPRVPVNETLVLNTGKGEKGNSHSLKCSFSIHAAKDAELISFGLCDIEPYIEYHHCVQSSCYGDAGTTLASFFSMYTNQVIELVCYRKLERRGERRVIQYDELSEVNLNKSVYPLIHVTFSICSLNFSHTFALPTSQTSGEVVRLEEPLVLKKAYTPYIADVVMNFNCCIGKAYCSEYKMKIRYNKGQGTVKSKDGQIEVSSQSEFGLLKSIQFRNLANRHED